MDKLGLVHKYLTPNENFNKKAQKYKMSIISTTN